jgi:hypothetical protein
MAGKFGCWYGTVPELVRELALATVLLAIILPPFNLMLTRIAISQEAAASDPAFQAQIVSMLKHRQVATAR